MNGGDGGRVPLLWQLSAPERTSGLDPGPGDRRPRPARGRPDHAAAAAPCILLLTRCADGESRAIESMVAKVGIRCLRIDADEAGQLRMSVDPGPGTITVDGHAWRPAVTWARHFSARAIGDGSGSVAEKFAQDSWDALSAQLSALSPARLPARSPGQLHQIAVASRLGIQVPRTIGVTDPSLAMAAIASPRVVIKAAGDHLTEAYPGRLTWTFADIVAHRELAAPWPDPRVPVIVQEYVEHSAELRAYYVDGVTHTFDIVKESPSAPWLRPSAVSASLVNTPAQIADIASSMAAELGLRYAALDLLVTPRGPVFLEANGDGDWRWVEERAATAVVTQAVSALLVRLYRANCGSPGRPDLLTFLTGRRR